MSARRAAPRGALLVVTAATLWGTTGTSRELGPDGAAPLSVGAVRLALGGGLLLAATVARGARLRPGTWPRGPLVVGILAMAAYQPLFFGGVSRAGVAVGTVVGIGSAPIAGGLLGRVLRNERLGAHWLVATALGLAGAALLAFAGDDGGDADRLLLGLVLAVGAGVAYAVYVAASAELLDRHPPGEVAAVVLGGGGLLLLPVALATDLSWLGEPGGPALALWLGVATVAVAYPLLARGLAQVGVGPTATLTLAEPATAAVLGLVVLDEQLSVAGWAGLALVAAGVVVEALRARATAAGAGASPGSRGKSP